MGKLIVTIADHTGEVGTVTFPGSDLTAANIDAEETQMATLRAELADVMRGLELKYTEVAKVAPQAVGKASSAEAQREEKALVRYYDDTTFERATLEIPCVDMTKQMTGHPGKFYIDGESGAHADWTAFVTAFEAYVLPPGGNTAVVEEVIHVGRNI
jgi:hypothetical protein